MTKEQHTLTIDKDGKVTLAVSGVKGKGCIGASADLQAALGQTVNDHITTEYNEREQSNTRNQQ